MFGWFSRKKSSRYLAGADRADRNAVIQRIVSAAAAELKRNGEGPAPPPGSPPTHTADGQPVVLLPAGKPPSGVQGHPAARQPPSPDDPPPDAVARRAMEIWIRRGRPAGTADQDWQQALAELRDERP